MLSRNKKGQMPTTEVVAIAIVIIIIIVMVIILLAFSHGSSNVLGSIWNVISFSWLFGNGL